MEIKSITAITEPYPDGQRIVALAVEYPVTLRSEDLAAEQFAVPGRRITGVYAALSAETAP